MVRYARRVYCALTEGQYQALTQVARETRRPMSILIRDAIEAAYSPQTALERRRAALKRLLALNAPTADWSETEQEIVRGATEG